MKKCIIVGKPNVGKTTFLINFAEYLGAKTIEFEFAFPDGTKFKKKYPCKSAISDLVDENSHKTLALQGATLEIPVGKGKKKIQVIDTTGLIDGIHEDPKVRRSISQTIYEVLNSQMIIHIIDGSAVTKEDLPSSPSEVDFQISQIARLKKGYVILVNKMDLPGAEEGLKIIEEKFHGNVIIPVCAINKKGFKEVKTFVAYNL
ncbi:MAG: GTPase [Bacillota bacterium]|nr:MAG: GTP-binding protein HSR1 [Bacillota bacterium]